MKLPIGYLLKQIHIKCQSRINKDLATEDLTASQLDLLNFLLDHREQKVTQKDIGNYMEIKHTTVIGIVKRLEEKGFVRSSVDPVNRKYRNISLTPKAVRAEEKILSHRKNMDVLLVKGMTAEEIEQLRQLLQKVRDNLSAQHDN